MYRDHIDHIDRIGRTASTHQSSSKPPRLAGERRGVTGAKPRTYIAFLGFIVLLIPLSIDIGGLRITPLRITLLVATIPLLYLFLSDRKRVQPFDVLVILFCLWTVISMIAVHGLQRLEFAGISLFEYLGGYLFGRMLIRSDVSYSAFVCGVLVVLLCLAPLAFFEFFTGVAPVLEILSGLSSVERIIMIREDFFRAQVLFPHPILFGLFCSIGVGLIFFNAPRIGPRRLFGGAVPLVLVGTSLSSGPLLSALMQVFLIVWRKITGGRWKLLTILTIIGYVALDSASNRSPVQIIIEELTFASHTGWYRVNIFNYGIESVYKHPVFGIGLNDWARPDWMWGSSVDNFWLLTAMRHGAPAFVLIATAIAILVFKIATNASLSGKMQEQRTGYLISLCGLIFALTSVHVWEQMVVFVMFLFGAGGWFAEQHASLSTPSSRPGPERQTVVAEKRSIYTRQKELVRRTR
jgi:hypothetical protein